MARLAGIFQGLIEVLHNIQQQKADAAAATTVAVPCTYINLNPFTANSPFDIGSRAGSHAFEKSSATTDTTWNGTIENFPAFLLSLCVCASEVNWGAAAPRGTLLLSFFLLFSSLSLSRMPSSLPRLIFRFSQPLAYHFIDDLLPFISLMRNLSNITASLVTASLFVASYSDSTFFYRPIRSMTFPAVNMFLSKNPP